MAVPEMSTLRYGWTVMLCIWLPRWGQASPIPPLEEPRSFPGELDMVDLSALGQDDNVDVQALLKQFLYTLNLTEQESESRPRTARVEPPEYMMELYKHYANDRSTGPTANIARSFKNEDSAPYRVTSRGVRTHPLMFNVSVPRQERIIAAELRLYMLVRRDPGRYGGDDWKVTVFEMQGEGGSSLWPEGARPEKDLIGMWELVQRHGRRKDSGWEAFDLTDAVRRWVESDDVNHWLELHVESASDGAVENQMQQEEKEGGVTLNSPDVERNSGGKHEPVLIVFSDKESDRQDKDQLPEDNGLAKLSGLWVDEKEDGEERRDEALLMQMRSNMIYDNAPRTRRNAKANPCKRTQLYVDFKDIGWDSWIVAPPGYEAYACQGECDYPLLPQVTPTKHAIVQALVNLKNSHRVSRPCCVPTKLEPISLLYENENGHVIFQHKYEGMVVAECGCR